MLGVKRQEKPKVGMWFDDAGSSHAAAAFVQQQLSVRFQQRVQSIEHAWVAQIGIVQQHPLAILNCSASQVNMYG